ncbi:MAG TPA: septation protein SpoVG family protein [Planctomycetota bacterium]|nr:septation protein SpoVG family protein [Planctomycetota bacterium]
MLITEVRIKLMSANNDRLRAFCSITIDNDFVIRDLKVIEGSKGPFVAMPSRKLMGRCSRCSGKNHYHARYCNECGARLQAPREYADSESRLKLHADIAHPINSTCRELIQKRILEEYGGEIEKAKDPSYQPTALDVFEEDYLEDVAAEGCSTYTETPRPEGMRAHEPLRMHTEPRAEDFEGGMDSSPGEGEAGRRQVVEGLEPPARGPGRPNPMGVETHGGGWPSRGQHAAPEGRDARPPRGRPEGEGRGGGGRFGGGRSTGPSRPDGRSEMPRGGERNAPLEPARGERGAGGRRGRRDEPLEGPRRPDGPRPFSTARSAGASSREEDLVLDRALDEAGRERTTQDAGFVSTAPRQRAPSHGAPVHGAPSQREASAPDGGIVPPGAPLDARIDPRERERLDRTEPEDNFGAGLFS